MAVAAGKKSRRFLWSDVRWKHLVADLVKFLRISNLCNREVRDYG